MHTHLHRTPQPNTFPSFTPKNTPRMVREPHRTHGNKTRISSFTDSRTTICALCHTPTPISILSPLVFRCHFHTVVQNKHLLQRASTGHTRRGVTPGPFVCHIHTVYYPTPLSRPSVSRVSLSLSATGFPVTPPEPGPAPSSASGFRPSGLCTPVSPGVPTGARNLGVCVFSCFTLTLCYCLSAFSFSVLSRLALPLSPRTQPLLQHSRTLASKSHPIICYPPLLSSIPSSHAPSCFPCILPTNPTDPPRHPFGTSGEGG